MTQDWFVEQANAIYEEILVDAGIHEYWHPKINKERWPANEPIHHVFEQAYMKFLNGNLNYYYFPNMVASTEEQNHWNKSFPQTINFCENVRNITGNIGPFGRMCVWKLPAGKRLLPHVDNFEYHRHIIRNIFVISKNIDSKVEIIINKKLKEVKQGTFFQFHPDIEEHEFINNGNEDFYFLGFDYWETDKLHSAKTRINTREVINDPERIKFAQDGALIFGSMGTRCKFQSADGLDLGTLR